MSARDPKWQHVRGGITRRDDYPPGTARVTVEVVSPDGHVVGQAYLISDEARAMAYVDPLPMVLDEMVRKIDEAIHA